MSRRSAARAPNRWPGGAAAALDEAVHVMESGGRTSSQPQPPRREGRGGGVDVIKGASTSRRRRRRKEGGRGRLGTGLELAVAALLLWSLAVLYLQVVAWRQATPFRVQLQQYSAAKRLLAAALAVLPSTGSVTAAAETAAVVLLRDRLGWEEPKPSPLAQMLAAPPRPEPFELGVFTTLWRRPQLSALTLQAWQQMQASYTP